MDLLAPKNRASESQTMARKRKSAPKEQLSLFDFGLDGSKQQVVPTTELSAQSPEILPPELQQLGAREKSEWRPISPGEPSAFERASYEHYMRLKTETYNLAKVSGILALLLISVVILGVKVSEAGLGPLKISLFRHSHLVGLLGWLTLLSSGMTLLRAAYMLRKKIDCGLFYQRVLQFSGSPLIAFLSRCFGILFVAVFVSIIALTWVLARTDMLAFVDLVVRGILMPFDPWAATVTPTLGR